MGDEWQPVLFEGRLQGRFVSRSLEPQWWRLVRICFALISDSLSVSRISCRVGAEAVHPHMIPICAICPKRYAVEDSFFGGLDNELADSIAFLFCGQHRSLLWPTFWSIGARHCLQAWEGLPSEGVACVFFYGHRSEIRQVSRLLLRWRMCRCGPSLRCRHFPAPNGHRFLLRGAHECEEKD